MSNTTATKWWGIPCIGFRSQPDPSPESSTIPFLGCWLKTPPKHPQKNDKNLSETRCSIWGQVRSCILVLLLHIGNLSAAAGTRTKRIDYKMLCLRISMYNQRKSLEGSFPRGFLNIFFHSKSLYKIINLATFGLRSEPPCFVALKWTTRLLQNDGVSNA